MDLEQCRICLGKGLLTNLFDSKNAITTSFLIMSFAKVQIHPNDGLPSSICIKCLKRLNKCIQFKMQCETSDKKLQTLLQSTDCPDLAGSNDQSIDEETDKINEELSKGITIDLKDTITSEVDVINKVYPNYEIVMMQNNCYSLNNSSDINNMKTKKQQCFKCGKVLSSRFRLKTHLSTHTGEKPFACPSCPKTFALEQNRKVHMRIHTGEKPLKCGICGMCFAQSAGLTAHKRKHTGHYPYQCKLCPRNFRTWGHLQYHIKRHTGEKNFECDVCGRAFITHSDMKQHARTHTGEKPHVCCTCGLRVARASHLKRHMQHLHNSSETKYSCTTCSDIFSELSDFEKHKRTHEEGKDALV